MSPLAMLANSAGNRHIPLLLMGIIAIAATACGSADAPTRGPASATTAPAATSTVAAPASASTPTAVSPGAGLDTAAFEEINPRPELRAIDRSIDLGFDEREALPRDAINPIYSPKFVPADEVAELLLDDELVMGLSVGGDARAYPVGIMRFREIVNDVVGGVPLLVTW